MSSGVFQPVGQKRLTNIAVVRMRKGGKRFEIACYKNKVLNWRNGVEKDLDEVLQTEAVFSNVSKGVLAAKEDLEAVFGTTDQRAICLVILEKGELQVSDKERKVELDALFRDVVSVLVDKCVNPQTGRPYTHTLLERALRDLHFAVDPTKPAKVQAFQALDKLRAVMPIDRARMRLLVEVPEACEAEARDLVRSSNGVVESTDLRDGMFACTLLVDPGSFRDMDAGLQRIARGKYRLEVATVAVQEADEHAPAQGLAAPPVGQMASLSLASARNVGGFQLAATSAGAARGSTGQVMAAPRSGPSLDPGDAAGPSGRVVVPRCAIGALPAEYETRRERFAELDGLQPGWTVELREKGGSDLVDAVFYSPSGDFFKSFAAARRSALEWSKAHGS